MSLLSELDTQVDKTAEWPFDTQRQVNNQPTLNDLLMRVGGDFNFNCMRKRQIENHIRGIQAQQGHSVATPVYGIRGTIGAGLRALADKYFTPAPLSPDNIPGYRRIGQ